MIAINVGKLALSEHTCITEVFAESQVMCLLELILQQETSTMKLSHGTCRPVYDIDSQSNWFAGVFEVHPLCVLSDCTLLFTKLYNIYLSSSQLCSPRSTIW